MINITVAAMTSVGVGPSSVPVSVQIGVGGDRKCATGIGPYYYKTLKQFLVLQVV